NFGDGRSTPYNVSFTAQNAMTGSATTAIRVDRRPVVSVAASLTPSEGTPISVNVAVNDPDGEAIDFIGMNVSGLPAGNNGALTADLIGLPVGHNATFTENASHTTGTFTWTPTVNDGGHSYPVVFRAANVLTGSSTTTVTPDRNPVVTATPTVAGAEGAPLTV